VDQDARTWGRTRIGCHPLPVASSFLGARQILFVGGGGTAGTAEMGVPLKQMGLLCAVAVTMLSVVRFFHHHEVVRIHSNRSFQTNDASTARAEDHEHAPPPSPPVEYHLHFDNVDYDGVPLPPNAGTEPAGQAEGSALGWGAVVRTDAGIQCGYQREPPGVLCALR
jgi:hypothetical protein